MRAGGPWGGDLGGILKLALATTWVVSNVKGNFCRRRSSTYLLIRLFFSRNNFMLMVADAPIFDIWILLKAFQALNSRIYVYSIHSK